MNPYLATLLTFAIAIGFLRLMDFFAHRGWIDGKLSRKLIPFAITVQFALVGLGIMKDEASVQAMSRTGDRREILPGLLSDNLFCRDYLRVGWER